MWYTCDGSRWLRTCDKCHKYKVYAWERGILQNGWFDDSKPKSARQMQDEISRFNAGPYSPIAQINQKNTYNQMMKHGY